MEKKRGPKSSADLTRPLAAISVQRPKPPEELSEPEKAAWQAIVSAKPSDWFKKDSHGLLIQYCRHLYNASRISQIIETFINDDSDAPGWIVEYDRLLKMQERESRALLALARAMRITNQSRFHPRSAGRRSENMPKSDPPWLPSRPPHES
jgi:hypothetical protein